MLELFPHQEKALLKLDNGKVLRSDPGAGKTHVGTAYYQRREWGRDVYVITTAKKRDTLDWQKIFASIGVGELQSVSGGVLTVDSWNNLPNYKDVKDAFFIFDEQRTVGSGAWAKSFVRVARANRWIILTATPGDTWMDYVPLFLANGFYKNRTAFVNEHVVFSSYTKFPKIERYRNTTKLQELRDYLLVEMPFERHTTRILSMIDVDYDHYLMDRAVKDRWNPFEERPIREASELYSVMRRIVNSDPSRIAAVKKLMKRHRSLIVFYSFDYELEILRTALGTASVHVQPTDSGTGKSSRNGSEKSLSAALAKLRGQDRVALQRLRESLHDPENGEIRTEGIPLTVAEYNGHKHQDVPEVEPWVYLVQYTAGAEAWDCVTTNATCFYSLQYSYKIWEQAQGRVDRLNTEFVNLYYYLLMSSAQIDRSIWNALDDKRDFNESSRRDMPIAA